jgi:hypothetical protein
MPVGSAIGTSSVRRRYVFTELAAACRRLLRLFQSCRFIVVEGTLPAARTQRIEKVASLPMRLLISQPVWFRPPALMLGVGLLAGLHDRANRKWERVAVLQSSALRGLF